MIKMITNSYYSGKTISEKMISDNWWNVYLESARMDGRRIIHHNENSYTVVHTEKNRIYTFIR